MLDIGLPALHCEFPGAPVKGRFLLFPLTSMRII